MNADLKETPRNLREGDFQRGDSPSSDGGLCRHCFFFSQEKEGGFVHALLYKAGVEVGERERESFDC